MPFGRFWCAILLIASTAMAMAQPNLLNLKNLVSLAEQNNFSLAESRLTQDQANSAVTNSRSSLLPNLSVETSGAWARSVSPSWTSQADVVLKQNLYDGGLSWTALRRSQVARERANFSVKNTRENITFEVIKAFVACGQKESGVRAAKRKLELLESQIELVNRQFKQGLKQRRNFQLLEAEVQRAHLAIERAENQVFDAYQALGSLVGSPQAKIESSTIKMLNGDDVLALKKWKMASLDYNSEVESLELHALQLNVRDRELAVRQAKRLYWPNLSANATASYGAPNFIGTGASGWNERLSWNATVGVSLSWTIWDWGGTPAAIAQANAEHMIESKRLEQKKLEIKNEYQTLRHRIERSTQMLEIQKHIRDLERKGVLDVQKEYREGRLGYLDLIAGIEREIESEVNQENQAYEYFLAVAEFMKLKGTLYESVQTL